MNGAPQNARFWICAAWLLAALAARPPRAAAQLPTVSFEADSGSGLENASPISIGVQLSRPINSAVKVRYRVIGGTAARNVDYLLDDGELTFYPVDEELGLRLDVINDKIWEPDETVLVELTSPTSATLGAKTLFTYTIINKSTAPPPTPGLPPEVAFAESESSVPESIGAAAIALTLVGQAKTTATVEYAIGGGTAVNGTDYALAPGTVRFGPGEDHKEIRVPIVSNGVVEGDRTVMLLLRNPTGATLGSPTTHTLTIIDMDAVTVSFENSASSASEAVTPASIPVALHGSFTTGTVTVRFQATGTATPDRDYVLPATSLTFNPGEQRKAIPITIVGDQEVEDGETIVLTLTGADNAFLDPPTTHTHTIIDNDTTISLAGFDTRFSSGHDTQSPAQIPVHLLPAGDRAVTVNYAVDPASTATPGVDYILNNGTLNFARGETQKTIAIQILHDRNPGLDKTVVLNLSNPQEAKLDRITTHKYWIIDTDEADIPLTLFKQNVPTVDAGKRLQIVGPLSQSVTLRGMAVDDAGYLYITDQGPHQGKAEGSVLLSPPGSKKAIRILRGLTRPSGIRLTPDQRGFVVALPDGGLLTKSFGISIKIANLDVLTNGTTVHVQTDNGEKVQQASPDGYFHFLDILAGGQASDTVDITVEDLGRSKRFNDLPLGVGSQGGAVFGHRVVTINF